MKIYIDFDGVILNTAPILFKEWLMTHDEINVDLENKTKYLAAKDWDQVLDSSEEINNSFEFLKQMDIKNTAILTKVHSLTNEGTAKINFLRKKGIKQEIILVPYNVSKKDVVPIKDNVLIDDFISNLDEWVSAGGYGIFFNKDNLNVDDANRINTKYKKINSLDINNIISIIKGENNNE